MDAAMTRQLVIDALRMAWLRRKRASGLIFHYYRPIACKPWRAKDSQYVVATSMLYPLHLVCRVRRAAKATVWTEQ